MVIKKIIFGIFCLLCGFYCYYYCKVLRIFTPALYFSTAIMIYFFTIVSVIKFTWPDLT
jgi:hypothetical protein